MKIRIIGRAGSIVVSAVYQIALNADIRAFVKAFVHEHDIDFDVITVTAA